jgi:hypothetical protein
LIDLEIVTRTEQRVGMLRERVVDLQVQEMELQARLDDLDYRMTPEVSVSNLRSLKLRRSLNAFGSDKVRSPLSGEGL